MSAGAAPADGRSLLLTTAAFVIVVAGMREAQAILVPFLLSGFIAIIAAPVLVTLTARRIPTALALLLVILLIVGIGMLLGVLVGSSVDDFSAQLPIYQDKLQLQMAGLIEWLAGMGVPVPEQALSKFLDPGKAMKMAAQGLSSLGGLLTDTLLILLTVIFILFEASSFPAKLRKILHDPEQSYGYFDRFVKNIKHYMAIKTGTSVVTALAVSCWLWMQGVDYPVLWGVLAFFLNYVPNIGSVIAAIPAVLLALIQLGPGSALWTLFGYLLINGIVGNLIEPRFMGRGLGLSTLVVFLSLVFWGWVLGAVGMFLSVPLTMTVMIALDSRDDTRWMAVLLGPDVKEERPSGEAKNMLSWLSKTAGKSGRE